MPLSRTTAFEAVRMTSVSRPGFSPHQRHIALRQREQTLRAELQAIVGLVSDRAAFLRLAETLTAFLTRLRSAAETLNVTERQRIVRLVVKDILVGDNTITITIRHSIPVPSGPPQNGGSPPSRPDGQSYLLCKGSDNPTMWSSIRRFVKDRFEGSEKASSVSN